MSDIKQKLEDYFSKLYQINEIPKEHVIGIKIAVKNLFDIAIAERDKELIDKINEYADSQSDKDIAMGIRGTISLIKD